MYVNLSKIILEYEQQCNKLHAIFILPLTN